MPRSSKYFFYVFKNFFKKLCFQTFGMSEHGQEKSKLAVTEAVIQDEDVPWGAKPKNPHNFRVTQVASSKNVDPLRPMNQVPDNDAFRAFLEKKNSQ